MLQIKGTGDATSVFCRLILCDFSHCLTPQPTIKELSSVAILSYQACRWPLQCVCVRARVCVGCQHAVEIIFPHAVHTGMLKVVPSFL